MAGIQIPVSATFSSGNIDQQISSLENKFNSLGKSASSLGDVKFNPISGSTAKEMQAMTQRFSALLNSAKQLQKTLKDTGQGGKNWHEVDWKQVYPNDYQRKRYMHTLLNNLRENSVSFSNGGPSTKPPWQKDEERPQRRHASGAPTRPSVPRETPSEQRSGGDYNAVVSRGMASTGSLARGGAALAGIMGVMAMAGRSVDLAREEAVAQDQLLRGTGDLNNEFDRLRSSVRMAGEGLGVTYTESAGLARHYSQVANATDGDAIGENVRSGIGLSRAYGLELSEGVSFMGTARHYGAIGSNDPDGRRFALIVAEAIEKGQATAKSGEMLAAIANYTGTLARHTLTSPNAAGFAGAVASLTKDHVPGLGPSEAANLMMSADNTVRKGGGMGEAGMNFTYAMLSRENPNITPITAMAIAEMGLFGSGKALEDSPFADYMRQNGEELTGLSGRSNFEVMSAGIDRMYSNPGLRLDAYKNFFGLSSYQHASALASMEPTELGSLEKLLGRAGVSIGDVSSSGIQNLGALSAADDHELQGYYRQIRDRDDITEQERRQMDTAAEGGDPEALRQQLARVVAVREQEKNVATDTRDGVAQLNNTLTTIGNGLLPAVSGIQSLVAAMAESVAPESEYVKQIKLQRGYAEYQREQDDLLARQAGDRVEQKAALDKRDAPEWLRERAISGLQEQQQRERENFYRSNHEYVEYGKHRERSASQRGTSVNESLDRLNRPEKSVDGPINLERHRGSANDNGRPPLTPSERAVGGATVGPVTFTSSQMSSMRRAADGDPAIFEMLKSAAALENWGYGKVRKGEVSPKGASGPFQFIPPTARHYGVKDPTDFDQAATGAAAMFRDLLRQYHGDSRAAIAHYNGGTRNGALVAGGGIPDNPETRQYVDRYDRISDGGLLPKEHAKIESLRAQKVRLDVGGTFVLEDTAGNRISEIQQPSIYQELPVAAGARR